MEVIKVNDYVPLRIIYKMELDACDNVKLKRTLLSFEKIK